MSHLKTMHEAEHPAQIPWTFATGSYWVWFGIPFLWRGSIWATYRRGQFGCQDLTNCTYSCLALGGFQEEGCSFRHLYDVVPLLKDKVGLILMSEMFLEDDPLQMTESRQKGNRLKAQSRDRDDCTKTLGSPGVRAAGLAKLHLGHLSKEVPTGVLLGLIPSISRLSRKSAVKTKTHIRQQS